MSKVTPSWVSGWSGLVGAKGATGAQGQRGPTGPAGTAGTTGSPGMPGPAGATGQQGALGLQGPQGDIGPRGMTGAQGPASLQAGYDGGRSIQLSSDATPVAITGTSPNSVALTVTPQSGSSVSVSIGASASVLNSPDTTVSSTTNSAVIGGHSGSQTSSHDSVLAASSGTTVSSSEYSLVASSLGTAVQGVSGMTVLSAHLSSIRSSKNSVIAAVERFGVTGTTDSVILGGVSGSVHGANAVAVINSFGTTVDGGSHGGTVIDSFDTHITDHSFNSGSLGSASAIIRSTARSGVMFSAGSNVYGKPLQINGSTGLDQVGDPHPFTNHSVIIGSEGPVLIDQAGMSSVLSSSDVVLRYTPGKYIATGVPFQLPAASYASASWRSTVQASAKATLDTVSHAAMTAASESRIESSERAFVSASSESVVSGCQDTMVSASLAGARAVLTRGGTILSYSATSGYSDYYGNDIDWPVAGGLSGCVNSSIVGSVNALVGGAHRSSIMSSDASRIDLSFDSAILASTRSALAPIDTDHDPQSRLSGSRLAVVGSSQALIFGALSSVVAASENVYIGNKGSTGFTSDFRYHTRSAILASGSDPYSAGSPNTHIKYGIDSAIIASEDSAMDIHPDMQEPWKQNTAVIMASKDTSMRTSQSSAIIASAGRFSGQSGGATGASLDRSNQSATLGVQGSWYLGRSVASVIMATDGGVDPLQYHESPDDILPSGMDAVFDTVLSSSAHTVVRGSSRATVQATSQTGVDDVYDTVVMGGTRGSHRRAFRSLVGGGSYQDTYGLEDTVDLGGSASVSRGLHNSLRAGGQSVRMSSSAQSALVAGTDSNMEGSANSAMLAGRAGVVQASSESAQVAGGNAVIRSCSNSVTVGGRSITLLGSESAMVSASDMVTVSESTNVAVVGGSSGIVTGSSNSVMGGGSSNRLSATNSFLGGGSSNNLSAQLSAMLGGALLDMSNGAFASAIVGGTYNSIMYGPSQAFIIGGTGDSVRNGSNSSGIVGCERSMVTDGSYRAVLVGGQGHDVHGANSFATVGSDDVSVMGRCFRSSVVASGSVTLRPDSFNDVSIERVAVLGSTGLTVDGAVGLVLLGVDGLSANRMHRSLVAASTGVTGFLNEHTAVLASSDATAFGAESSAMVGCQGSILSGGSTRSVLLGGYSGLVAAFDSALIAAPASELSGSSSASAVMASQGTMVSDGSSRSVVLGGAGHTIRYGSSQSAVVGGLYHTLTQGSYQSVVLGGQRHRMEAGSNDSAIVGGLYNQIYNGSQGSVILGGSSGLMGMAANNNLIAASDRVSLLYNVTNSATVSSAHVDVFTDYTITDYVSPTRVFLAGCTGATVSNATGFLAAASQDTHAVSMDSCAVLASKGVTGAMASMSAIVATAGSVLHGTVNTAILGGVGHDLQSSGSVALGGARNTSGASASGVVFTGGNDGYAHMSDMVIQGAGHFGSTGPAGEAQTFRFPLKAEAPAGLEASTDLVLPGGGLWILAPWSKVSATIRVTGAGVYGSDVGQSSYREYKVLVSCDGSAARVVGSASPLVMEDPAFGGVGGLVGCTGLAMVVRMGGFAGGQVRWVASVDGTQVVTVGAV